jgi:hypothetical protein
MFHFWLVLLAVASLAFEIKYFWLVLLANASASLLASAFG